MRSALFCFKKAQGVRIFKKLCKIKLKKDEITESLNFFRNFLKAILDIKRHSLDNFSDLFSQVQGQKRVRDKKAKRIPLWNWNISSW